MRIENTVGMIVVLQFVLCGTVESQTRVLNGRVHFAGDTARPVADAEVALLPGLRTARSDSGGRFHFSNIAPGAYVLRVRRVGLEVATQDVTVGGDQENRVIAIEMRSGVRTLAEVIVSGQRLLFPARLTEAYARVARGRGAFFTRELIDSLQPWDTQSLLIRLPGVRVNDRAIRVARCDNHGASGGPGNLHVFVDGIRQTSYDGYLTRGASEALRDVVMASVQLIEVHTSINTIPPEFADDACAVILVWSR